MRPRDPRHRCTLGQRRFDDPLLLVDCAVLPLGFGPRRALDWDEFCDLRGSVHLRSKWTRSVCVHFKRMTSNYTPVQTVAAVRLQSFPGFTVQVYQPNVPLEIIVLQVADLSDSCAGIEHHAHGSVIP